MADCGLVGTTFSFLFGETPTPLDLLSHLATPLRHIFRPKSPVTLYWGRQGRHSLVRGPQVENPWSSLSKDPCFMDLGGFSRKKRVQTLLSCLILNEVAIIKPGSVLSHFQQSGNGLRASHSPAL